MKSSVPAPVYRRGVLLALTLSLMVTATVSAQSTMGGFRGIVSDETGAALPGATVMLENERTGESRVTATDERGRYVFPSLPAAPYTLSVELQGFARVVQRGIELAVSQTISQDVTLRPAGIEEGVMVTAEAPVVNTTTSELGDRFDTKRLTELPINGRDYARFSLLMPGAVARSSFIADLTFNGLHGVHNSFTIDGIDASRVDQPYMANGYERGARLLTGSLDSIQEFRVSTGMYQAEYGRASGSSINIVTKSGGNAWHGGLFEFLRNSALDARNFFTPPEEPKPLYNLNQFGGNLSGPIITDSTFFFVNYEGSRQRLDLTGTGTVPGNSLRQRVVEASPELEPFLATLPLGTSPTDNPDVDNYTTVRKLDVREDTGSVRIDHRLSDRDSLMGRLNVNDTSTEGALFGVTPTALATDNFQDVPVRTTNWVVQHQRVFGSNVVNEAKVGMQRWDSQIISNTPFPQTTIVGVDIVPGTRGWTQMDNTAFQYVNNLSFTRGAHAFKTGVELRDVSIDRHSIDTVDMRYESLDDFVHNRVSSASFTPGDPGHVTRGQQIGAYFQDDWRVVPNLTLNLGLRYEYYTVLHDADDSTRPFNMEMGALDPAGSSYYRPDRNNWAPRLGVVWVPFPSGRTSVRGGYGWYYQAYPTGFGAYTLPLNDVPGATTLLRDDIPNLSFPLDPFVGAGSTPLPNVTGFDPNRRDIYTEQWTLNVQHEIATNTAIQIAYVGNRGHNIRRNQNINFLDPDLGRRPNPAFADISIEGNTGTSEYHAMQASFMRRFDEGLALNVHYTWGHGLDDVQDQTVWSGQPQDGDNLAAEWGNSSGDIRHNFAFNFIYDLPFGPGRRFGNDTSGLLAHLIGGWQLNGLGIIRSGTPFTVELGGNSRGNNNFTNQRPDRVEGVPTEPENRTIDNWLNRNAFAEPEPGTFGNLGRNTEYGPRFAQVDLSLMKNARLGASRTLQLRIEVFNIFNHPNFDNPTADFRTEESFGTAQNTFGRTIGLGTPRQIQIGLKYAF